MTTASMHLEQVLVIPSVVLVLVARLKYTSFMNTEPRMSLMLVKLKLKLEIKE
jgi:hypothetical protein